MTKPISDSKPVVKMIKNNMRSLVKQGKKNPMWGKHHSEETKLKMRKKNTGPNNGMWKGDQSDKDTARERARRIFKTPKGYEIHHIDGNPYNNSPENLKIVTRREHMIIDGRMDKLLKLDHSRSLVNYEMFMTLYNQGLTDGEISNKMNIKYGVIYAFRSKRKLLIHRNKSGAKTL